MMAARLGQEVARQRKWWRGDRFGEGLGGQSQWGLLTTRTRGRRTTLETRATRRFVARVAGSVNMVDIQQCSAG